MKSFNKGIGELTKKFDSMSKGKNLPGKCVHCDKDMLISVGVNKCTHCNKEFLFELSTD